MPTSTRPAYPGSEGVGIKSTTEVRLDALVL